MLTGRTWLVVLAILVCFSTSLILSCKDKLEGAHGSHTSASNGGGYFVVQGETMGTYYRVSSNCTPKGPASLKKSIDSLFIDINQAVSTYIPTSFISIVNQSENAISLEGAPDHFKVNLDQAFKYFELSDGYLDMSVLPLINYWGFGYTPKVPVSQIDSMKVIDLMKLVGLEKWSVNGDEIVKGLKDQQLDFSSIAKGYAVDEVGRLLSAFGCDDFLVDIGGEQVARGVSPRGNSWTVGINTPDSDARIDDAMVYLRLNNKAIATSGNYRIFHELNGVKYGHTINPKSGYPFQDELLSVTVIADNCIDADAISTACMAMGYRKATTFIETMPDFSACFLIGAPDGTIQSKFANGFIRYIFQPEF